MAKLSDIFASRKRMSLHCTGFVKQQVSGLLWGFLYNLEADSTHFFLHSLLTEQVN